MHNKSWRFFVGSFLTCLALSASAAIPSVEKLLPDDTLLLVTTPDFGKFRETYHASPQTQLWEDPAMKPFKDKFMSKLNENLLDPLEHDLGVHFSDYTNLLGGQITFAITQNGWPAAEGSKPGLLFLLDTKDKKSELTKDISDLTKKWVDAGKTMRTEKIRNIEFSVLPLSDKDIPKTLRSFSGNDSDSDSTDDTTATNAPKSDLYIGQYESLLILGTDSKPIEKVLVHLTGGDMPALGDLAAYEANRLALFRDAPIYGWANAKTVLDLFTQRPKENPEDPFAMLNPARILTALGFSSLKTLAFSLQLGTDGSTVQVFASIPESGRGGLFSVFPGASKDAAPPAFVPADVAKFQRWRMDGQKAWAAVQKILSDISPQAKTGINFMIDTANTAAKEKDPDFDMNKNFFGNLGDDMISYSKSPRGDSPADLASPPSLFLLGSPNPDQLVSALKYLLLLANPQSATPKEREFLGHKIYTVELGSIMGGGTMGGSAPKSRSLNYSSGSGYMAISGDDSMLEEYLRSSDSQQKALRETPGLTDAIAKVGGSTAGLFGYENQLETSRVAFETLRKGSAPSASSSPSIPGLVGMPSTDKFKDWMDFSLLPPFDKISKYFGFSVYNTVSTSDGIAFKMFTPVPAGLKK